jgi:O-acetyl-ADP-ribose deacetylase (regulator of RNase III)
MIEIIYGDLIHHAKEGHLDAIAHGCNCFCNMGAGIAKSIKKEFPNAFHVDIQTTLGDKSKLGTISIGYGYLKDYSTIDVINCYTQYKYGGKSPNVDYFAITLCMREINKRYAGKKVGMPKIGCGLAKGNWITVLSIMEEELTDVNVTVFWI